MTKKQYEEVVQRFAIFANKTVTYKSLNLYYKKCNAEYCKHKYNEHKGTLMGVGIYGNAYNLIIANCGQLHAIHYRNIKYPK